MSNSLEDKENMISKYLFSLYKDTADYLAEMQKELELDEQDLYMIKKIFAERVYKSFIGEDLEIILNHNREIVEQNEKLQNALIETNNKLEELSEKLQDCCDNCLVSYEECEIKCKRHITFKDILADIDEVRGVNRDNDG